MNITFDKVKVETTVTAVTPKSIWNNRFQMLEEYRTSIKGNEVMNTPENKAKFGTLQERVRQTLGLMIEHVDSIVEDGLEISEDGTVISIHMHMLVTDLNETHIRDRQETAYATRQAISTASKILEDI